MLVHACVSLSICGSFVVLPSGQNFCLERLCFRMTDRCEHTVNDSDSCSYPLWLQALTEAVLLRSIVALFLGGAMENQIL